MFLFFSVEKYQNHFSWLKDAKFLAELENDSVDSDIIEEELHALQEEELPSGWVSVVGAGQIDIKVSVVGIVNETFQIWLRKRCQWWQQGEEN